MGGGKDCGTKGQRGEEKGWFGLRDLEMFVVGRRRGGGGSWRERRGRVKGNRVDLKAWPFLCESGEE